MACLWHDTRMYHQSNAGGVGRPWLKSKIKITWVLPQIPLNDRHHQHFILFSLQQTVLSKLTEYDETRGHYTTCGHH